MHKQGGGSTILVVNSRLCNKRFHAHLAIFSLYGTPFVLADKKIILIVNQRELALRQRDGYRNHRRPSLQVSVAPGALITPPGLVIFLALFYHFLVP
jgi:hypothetical protein